MANKRLLVDGTHPEETRIVVTNGNRLEEFDFESQSRRQLRGNIYLAKVTRVEPSLQAAFVEYGGNRHGFLAFSEIHPDYYQIPVADREALLRADEAAAAEEESDAAEDAAPPDGVAGPVPAENIDESDEASHVEDAPTSHEPVESLGGGDALEDEPERRPVQPRRHHYKIQEVIKRRQVMLVQVVKEERGNKGAALTTYLSLAGRYSVLMPNTARGGGISRKITNVADRKRLREIVGDLQIPPGQGVILRTAGAARTKAEVARDFEYLQRLWESVRTLTLQSTAPCLVYEEGSLIKRTIRDLYSKDIDELIVAGETAHREAKDFMRMMMPSHAESVLLHRDDQPLFSRFGVESQLDQMFSPQVTLPSGGYLVINPTEALVSIDVNSGRATKEHNIEDTALQTNLEAADEVARQLRLRDLAGLVVIDFIDMVENRSNRAVERRLKDALKNDRARIQVGRISHFGLLEMSRQRIRFGVVESSTHKCPTCNGTGLVRSVESIALMVIRSIEDYVLRRPGQSINVRVPIDVALYILNGKREAVAVLEAKHGLSVNFIADDHVGTAHFAIERGEARTAAAPSTGSPISVDTAGIADDDTIEDSAEEERPAVVVEEPGERGRRRRRRGGGRDERRGADQAAAAEPDGDKADDAEGEDVSTAAVNDERAAGRRRRRGRRGGRRGRREGSETPTTSDVPVVSALAIEESAEPTPEMPAPAPIEATPEPAPERPKRRSRKAKTEAPVEEIAAEAPLVEADALATVAPEKPKRRTRKTKPAEPASVDAPATEIAEPAKTEVAVASPADDEPARRPRRELPPEGIIVSSTSATPAEKPKRGGWWQRGFFGD